MILLIITGFMIHWNVGALASLAEEETPLSSEECKGRERVWNYISNVCPHHDRSKFYNIQETGKTIINPQSETAFMKSICSLANSNIAAEKGYYLS